MKKRTSLEHIRKHIDKKLQRSLRIYFIISLILIGVISFEIITGVVKIEFALIGIAIGVFLGFFTARMYHISWDHDAKQIVSKLDKFGGIILVLYIILAFSRKIIISYFIHGPAVGGVSIAIVTGIMVGRVLGTRGKIIQILKEQQVF